jgi:hypothetical protein
MANVIDRLRMRLRRKKAPDDRDPDQDWKTAGKTFWPSQELGHSGTVPQNYVPPADEGRPLH